MKLPDGYAVRAAEPVDLEPVVELLKAADRADAGVEDPVREHLAHDWQRSSMSLERDTRVVVAPEGRLAGYACISGDHPERSLENWVRIHPDHRGAGLGAGLLEWTEALALERSPQLPVLRNAIPDADGAARELLEQRRYGRARTAWHMARDLVAPIDPVAPPAGIELRRYVQTDLRTLYDVLEEAFLGQWASEPYPYEDHARDMASWDPDLAWLAFEGDRPVGASLASLVEGSGWVDVLGVLGPWRRRGVGRALLLRQFASLAARGVPLVALNVDAENPTGAPSVYTSAGMRVHRAWNIYEKRFGGAG